MRALIAALLVLPSAATAAFYDGNAMYENCKKAPNLVGMYAAGVLEGGLTVEEWASGIAVICPSENVTVGQTGDMLCQHLEQNPSQRHLSASSIALTVFLKAWPCS